MNILSITKKLIKNSNIYHKVRLLFSQIYMKEYLSFMDELKYNRHLGIEYLSKESLHSPYWNRELFKTNEYYAHDIIFKEYANIPYNHPLSCLIEHGLVLTEHLIENVKIYPLANINIVMSEARKHYLNNNGIPAFSVGPYINYAKSLYSDNELELMKKKLGKTLLFFPSHSTKYVSVKDSYSMIEETIRKLKIKHGFSSVLICGYFMDINNKLFEYIKKEKGYYFVSAGDRRGPLFLNLIKTYILLSDVVASNTIGTQTGYSIFLNKPFWTVSNENINDIYVGSSEYVKTEKSIINKPLIGNYNLSYSELEKLFTKQIYEIDKSVLKIVSDLWGFNDIKSEKEIQKLCMKHKRRLL